MFMTGELDDPSTHADAMRRDLERLGIPTGLTIIPNGPHAFLGQQKHFDVAVDACVGFFKRHLQRPTVGTGER
jgi:pectinesterase